MAFIILRKLLLSVSITLVVAHSFAQTNNQDQYTPGQSTSANTSVSNYLNLSSGTANFSVPLAESYGLNLAYSSILSSTANELNSDIGTGLVGLGWSFNIPGIIADHKNTGTRIDDEFYLSEGGSLNLLHCIDKTATYNQFVSSDISRSQIYYYPDLEEWKVIKTDGSTYYFGGNDKPNDAVSYSIKWGNWMGASPKVLDDQGNVEQELLANAWYLSEVKDNVNRSINYMYDQEKEKVCFNGSDPDTDCSQALSYTKAMYLSEINRFNGEKLQLHYELKAPYEYADPFNKDPEPDAYQEPFSTKYLSSIESFNRYGINVGKVSLDYNIDKPTIECDTLMQPPPLPDTVICEAVYATPADPETTKRLLTSVTSVSHTGKQSQPMEFDYYPTGDLKGYLKSVMYPGGAEISYEYDTLSIPINNGVPRTTISSPGANFKQPYYKMYGNYIVACWRNTSTETVQVDLYEWDTEWIKTANIAQFSDVEYVGETGFVDYAHFDIHAKDGFFAIRHENKLKIFHKDPCKTSLWYKVEKTLPSYIYDVDNGVPGPNYHFLLSGDKYIAVGLENGDVYAYVEGRWDEQFFERPNQYEDDYQYSYQHNFFVSNSEDHTFTRYVLDEAKHWSVQTRALDVKGQPTCTANSCYYTQDGTNDQRMFSWDENFDLDSLSYLDLPNNPSGTGFAQIKGLGNIMTVKHTSASRSSYRYATYATINKDVYIKQYNVPGDLWTTKKPLPNKSIYYKKTSVPVKYPWIVTKTSTTTTTSFKYTSFDANRYSWEETSLSGTAEPINNNTLNVANGNTFIANKQIYHLGNEDDLTNVGDLWSILSDEADSSLLTDFEDFQFHQDKLLAGNGYYVLSSPVTNDSYIIFINQEGLQSKSTLSGIEVAYEGAGGEYFIAHSSNEDITNATSLYIYDIVKDQVSSQILDHPVKRIGTNDGYQTTYTRIDYDPNHITFGNGGKQPQYSKIVEIAEGATPGNHLYGETEYQFYNGNELDNFPYDISQENGGNANNSPKFRGLPIRSIVRDNSGDTLVMNETSYKIFEENYYCNGGMKIGTGLAIRPVAQVVFSEGIWNEAFTSYNSDILPVISSQFNVNANGDLLEYNTEYLYSHEIYPELASLNIRTPVQVKRSVYNHTLDSTSIMDISATTWKDWGGYWAPFKSWTWTGKGGLEDFNSWYGETDPNNWLNETTIQSRDEFSNPLEVVGIDNLVKSSIYQFDEYPVASFLNANSKEVFFDNFDYLDSTLINQKWIISDSVGINNHGKLKIESASQSSGYITPIFADHDNILIEYDLRHEEEKYTAGDWIGFQVQKNSASGLFNDSGYTVRFFGNGMVDLYHHNNGILIDSTLEHNFFSEHHITIAYSGNNIAVFVDGFRLFDENVSGGLHTELGFVYNSSQGLIDNVRIYPDDALAKSNGYEATYEISEAQTDAVGKTSKSVFNKNLALVGELDHLGNPRSIYSSFNSAEEHGHFNPYDPSSVLKTVILGDGYHSSFEYNQDGWSKLLTNSCSDWEVNDGVLNYTQATGTCTSEIFSFEHDQDFEGRVGIKFDVRTNDNAVDLELTAGDQNWDGVNGSQSHVNTTLPLDSGEIISYMMIIDYNTDYYVVLKNGKYMSRNSIQNDGDSFRKVSFEVESLDSCNVEIDNFFLFEDFSNSITYFDASGKEIQTQMDAGKTFLQGNFEYLYDTIVEYDTTIVINYDKSGNIVDTVEIVTTEEHYFIVDTIVNGGYYESTIVAQQIYDELGRPHIVARPTYVPLQYYSAYLRFTSGFAEFNEVSGMLEGEITQHHLYDSGYSFSRVMFDNSPLSRQRKTSSGYGPERRVDGSRSVQYDFGVPSDFTETSGILLYDDYRVNCTLQPDSTKSFTVSDIAGNVLFEKFGEVNTGSLFNALPTAERYITRSYNYNDKGQSTGLIPPAYYAPLSGQTAYKDEFIQEIQHDFFGRVTQSSTSDMGLIRNIYSEDGKLRFSQDSAGMKGIDAFDLGGNHQQYFKYIKYDQLGNTIESGYHFSEWDETTLQEMANIQNWPNAENMTSTINVRFDGEDAINFPDLNTLKTNELSVSQDSSIKIVNDIASIYLPINIASSVTVSAYVYAQDEGNVTIQYLSPDSSLIDSKTIWIEQNQSWYPLTFDPLIAANNGLIKVQFESATTNAIYFDNISISYTSLSEMETWHKRYSFYELEGDFYERKLLKEEITNNGFGEIEALNTIKYSYNQNAQISRKSQRVGQIQTSNSSLNYEYDQYGKLIRTYMENDNGLNEISYLNADSSLLVAGTKDFEASTGLVATDGFEIAAGSTSEIKPNGSLVQVNPTYLPDISYHYDDMGRLVSVGNNAVDNYYIEYSYGENGIAQTKINSGSITSNFLYDNQGRLRELHHGGLFKEEISYNENDLISSLAFTFYNAISSKTPGNEDGYINNYTYDELGRLVSVSSDLGTEYNLSADYDANGNFISTTSNDNTKNFTYYPGTNRVKSVSASGSEYLYDPRGNIIRNENRDLDLTYDKSSNLPRAIENDSLRIDYGYGPGKSKVYKGSNMGEQTSYLHDLDGSPLVEQYKDHNQQHTRFVVTGPTGIIAIVQDGQPYFLIKDHLGSPVALVDQTGEPVLIIYYGPHGHTNEKYISVNSNDFNYQFTGQENERAIGIYNYGSRMYDPELGIFYAVDPQHQFDSPYMAMGGNPLMIVDPNGEIGILGFFFIVAAAFGVGMGIAAEAQGGKFSDGFLVGTAAAAAVALAPAGVYGGVIAGSAIGAGTSGALYAGSSLVSGNFSWNGLGRSVALGAISGGVSGGISAIGGNFSNSVGLGILNSTISNVAGNAILGNEITAGMVLGGVAGGITGAGIPRFKGVKGGWLANIGAELAYESARGAVVGGISGGIAAAVDNRNIGIGIARGSQAGAIGAFTTSTLNILTLGPGIIPSEEYGLENTGRYGPIFRRGSIFTRRGAGFTFGRNIVFKELKEGSFGQVPYKEYNKFIYHHEYGHYKTQILEKGYALSFTKSFFELIKYNYEAYYTIGTNEYVASKYAFDQIGYWISIWAFPRKFYEWGNEWKKP